MGLNVKQCFKVVKHFRRIVGVVVQAFELADGVNRGACAEGDALGPAGLQLNGRASGAIDTP